MWSVLYECCGEIRKIGPFENEGLAMDGAKKALEDGEFSIFDQRVYLLTPSHRMIELSATDFQADNFLLIH